MIQRRLYKNDIFVHLMIWGHSFGTHTRGVGGGRVEQKRTPYVQEKLTHLSTYAKGPFLHEFLVFSYTRYFHHTLFSLPTTFITVL